MKYMHYPALDHLSAMLSTSPAPETKINVRFEVYSVKAIREERKMFKEMEEAYMSGQDEMEEMSFSPEMKEAGLSSCFGRLDEKESRKVHFQLVACLNAAFPDHDFSTLRPDQFTREPSAAEVLSHLSGSLAGQGASPMGPPTSSPLLRPLGSSPSTAAQSPFGMEHDRALQEAIDLDACEVYSWFPSPEYDPHAGAEEEEASEDGFDGEEELMDDPVEMDLDENETEASWGNAGMELDDGFEALQGGGVMETRRRSSRGKKNPIGTDAAMLPPTLPKRSSEEDGVQRRGGRLLWSTNYFFYSKRQKRILFLTCWCRKRTPFLLSHTPTEHDFPAPISTSLSFSSPSHMSTLAHRNRTRTRAKPTGRPLKKSSFASFTLAKTPARDEVDVDMTSMIPIRGMHTPAPPSTSARLASSAPAHTGFLSSPSGHGALAKMTAGGFKPKTPARVMINAAKASEAPAGAAASTSGLGLVGDRTRKERSESAQSPGTNLIQAGMGAAQGARETRGKRVKG